MKQIFKKVSSLCTVLLMMAVLTLTGVSSVWAADEVDDTVKQTLVTTAEGLTDTIIALSDEDIENYTKSSDEFTVGAMTAWAGSKDEVGALKERTGETEVKASDEDIPLPYRSPLRKQMQISFIFSMLLQEHLHPLLLMYSIPWLRP